MNMRLKAFALAAILIAGFAIILWAAGDKKEDTKTAATVSAKSLNGKAADEKKVEGTVVINSTNEGEADPYADENHEQASVPSGPAISRDPVTGLVTVDASGEDIRSVLRKVADLYDLNMVVPSTLNATTTLKLRGVTWQQLFNVMLPPAGFSYVEDKNIILIKSREEVSAEPTETRVFLVNYANASDLQSSIMPLIDATNGGKVQVDKRSNALVVTERPSKFNNIKDILERLDKPTPQVLIESKFIDLDETDAKNLGVDWSSLSSYKLSASSLTRTWTHGHRQDPTGTRWIDNAVFSAGQFDVILRALNTFNGSNLISNPTVVTLNNTEATINIGEEYPVPQYSYNQQQGVFEVSGFEYKPIGVRLKVTPQVNSQGYITLTVAPEVSSSNSTVTFGTTNSAQIPIIQTRKTSSTISIKDGYTLAIGGLIETTKTPTSSSVPILGGLPVVGKTVFGNTTTKVERRNLLIFITARTVNPDGSGQGTFNRRQMHEMGLSESDLPGYQPSEDEDELLQDVADRREAQKNAQWMANLRKNGNMKDPKENQDLREGKSPSRAHR
jgi:type IV pilus assembly protein PilQ